MTNPRAGIIQMCSTPDVASNLETASRLARDAAELGADIVLFPEAFSFIGPRREKAEVLEPLPAGGPILECCRNLAREIGRELVLGGFHEQCEDDPTRSRNACVHLGPDGEIRALYRKIHLFDVDLADGTRLHESAETEPGDRAVVTETTIGPLGLTVCYDVRYPVLYQVLAERGAIAVTVPSAFTMTTGKDHWHVLLQARAIECQVYVIAPAQFGNHYGKRVSYGHGLIVDPWGCVIAQCSDGEGVAVAEIDQARVANVRSELPSLANRREFT
jgi:predicted amidohydrolase